MKVIVTGGAGFLGSHVVEALVKRGDKVAVIDDLSTGKEENLNPKAKFTKYKLGSFNWPIEDDGTPVSIIHLAALPRVGRSIDNPLETHLANVNGTLEALEMARECKIKFIYVSSSSIYGTQTTLPLTEDLTPNPESPYATQKLIGELYCKIYKKVFGLNTIILRLFNVYGARMQTEGVYKLVFTNWIEQIKKNQPLIIYGDGEQTRDFTYVDDTVKGILLALDTEQRIDLPINLCTNVETSVNQLAELFDWESAYAENPRPNEEKRKVGSNQRAKELLGWKPYVSIVEGIERLKKEYEI